MNTLLIGGGGRLMDAMIDRMTKSGDRIYLLTGSRERARNYKRVFERYNFTYEDDSVKDVFESVKPDLVVFLGAYDSNFDWVNPRQESVRYTAALVNLLSAHAMTQKGRFVYLSSQEIYSGSYGGFIREEEAATPRGFRALALAQGEEICENYRKNQGLDILTLRLDHLYYVPQKGVLQRDLVFRMCLEALKTGAISANDRNVFSMLYLNDGVELAYKVMSDPTPSRQVYNISSMEVISEMQLAAELAEKIDGGVDIANNSVGEHRRIVLDSGRFQRDYEQKIFTDYKSGGEKVAKFMCRHRDSFIGVGDAGGGAMGRLLHSIKAGFLRLLPFIEALICFFPFMILNNQAAGSEYFSKLDFLLLYVLLFAVVHGQQQAIFAALLAVVGYFLGQIYSRPGFEVLLDPNTYVWVAQLFILGMVVGYMHDRLKAVRAEDLEEIDYLMGKLEDISEINDSNVRTVQSFEAQVVNQKDSLGKVYQITSGLEQYAPEEVLFYAAQVLGRLMNSRDAAIYTVSNGDYARLFSSTSQDARKLGGSIKYTAMGMMYDDLKAHRIYINRNMEGDYPLFACGVYAEDSLQLILMVWGIPWQRMTLAEANRLDITGRLIQDALVRANRYLDAMREKRYVGDSGLMAAEAFEHLVKAFFEARDKGLTECVLLEIPTKGKSHLEIAGLVEKNIRRSDYIGQMQDGKLYALLCNTDEDGAMRVIWRFKEAGYKTHIVREAAV